MDELEARIEKSIFESISVLKDCTNLMGGILKVIAVISSCLKNGNKILVFGNGGSAADAQHIAAELIGRFQKERKSLPAIALTTDSSILTAISNDYSFDQVFKRQCESLVSQGDVVIGISTSGNSANVIKGLEAAKKRGATTIGLLGSNGGATKSITDISLIVNSSSTPRIQEAHRLIYHIICDNVERELSGEGA
jgi:D-sedoheptulose 7-phosphate isomerase